MSYGARQGDQHHCGSEREFGIRFALWCHGLSAVPSADRIRVHWRMSRATAYRWRRAWCDAIGIEPPRPVRSTKVTPPEILRARKQSVGVKRAGIGADACRNCEFFRPPSGSHGWWGKCRKHVFKVQSGSVCTQFTFRGP